MIQDLAERFFGGKGREFVRIRIYGIGGISGVSLRSDCASRRNPNRGFVAFGLRGAGLSESGFTGLAGFSGSRCVRITLLAIIGNSVKRNGD